MFLVSLYRVFRFAIQNFWRNIWLSLVTVTIVILTLFSLTTLIVINVVFDQAFATVKEQIDIAIYFKKDAPTEQPLLIKQEIAKIDKIKELKLITAEESLQRFKEIHQDDSIIQQTLSEFEKNPLGAVLLIKANNLNDYPEILSNIEKMKLENIIEEIDYKDHQKLMAKLKGISDKVKNFGLGLSIFFGAIALLVVFNTIRIGIYTRREEMSIMRLVGATNWFIRLPFLVESIFYAVVGCVFFFLIFYMLIGVINPWLSAFFAEINFDLFVYFNNNFLSLFGFELIVMIFLNLISSIIAMSKYLKV